MLASRRRFLARGHYAPIARRISELAASHLSGCALPGAGPPRSVVDAGCGEGYYLGMMQAHLRASGEFEVEYLGVDSSRDACRMAARRYGDICFVVSDLKDLIPVADGSVHLLLNIFAPRSVTEFSRVLDASGLLIVVIPQPNHLQELRLTFPLLGIEERKADQVLRRLQPSLQLVHRESMSYELRLEQEEVIDLIGMSPSQRHLTEPLLPSAGLLDVTVAIELLAFQRRDRDAYNAGYPTTRGS